MTIYTIYLRHSDGIINHQNTTDKNTALRIEKQYRKRAEHMNTSYGSDSKFYTIIKSNTL